MTIKMRHIAHVDMRTPEQKQADIEAAKQASLNVGNKAAKPAPARPKASQPAKVDPKKAVKKK